MKGANPKVTAATEEKFKVVGELRNRSDLSDKMKALCVKLPIYQVRELDMSQNDDADQMDEQVHQSDVNQNDADEEMDEQVHQSDVIQNLADEEMDDQVQQSDGARVKRT